MKLKIIAGFALFFFTILFTFSGFIGWVGANDVCTGTGSVGFNFSRLCNSEVFICVFSILSIFLFVAVIILFIEQNIRPSVRIMALGIFIIYGLWVIRFPTGVWKNPFFTDRYYLPGVDPHCLGCPVATRMLIP